MFTTLHDTATKKLQELNTKSPFTPNNINIQIPQILIEMAPNNNKAQQILSDILELFNNHRVNPNPVDFQQKITNLLKLLSEEDRKKVLNDLKEVLIQNRSVSKAFKYTSKTDFRFIHELVLHYRLVANVKLDIEKFNTVFNNNSDNTKPYYKCFDPIFTAILDLDNGKVVFGSSHTSSLYNLYLIHLSYKENKSEQPDATFEKFIKNNTSVNKFSLSFQDFVNSMAVISNLETEKEELEKTLKMLDPNIKCSISDKKTPDNPDYGMFINVTDPENKGILTAANLPNLIPAIQISAYNSDALQVLNYIFQKLELKTQTGTKKICGPQYSLLNKNQSPKVIGSLKEFLEQKDLLEKYYKNSLSVSYLLSLNLESSIMRA